MTPPGFPQEKVLANIESHLSRRDPQALALAHPKIQSHPYWLRNSAARPPEAGHVGRYPLVPLV